MYRASDNSLNTGPSLENQFYISFCKKGQSSFGLNYFYSTSWLWLNFPGQTWHSCPVLHVLVSLGMMHGRLASVAIQTEGKWSGNVARSFLSTCGNSSSVQSTTWNFVDVTVSCSLHVWLISVCIFNIRVSNSLGRTYLGWLTYQWVNFDDFFEGQVNLNCKWS